MCGIAGCWQVDGGEVDAAAMLAGLDHRGPDDRGCFRDPRSGVTLLHTRLAIIDLSPAGHQPMVAADGDTVLVYNGEIYNFAELRAELEAEGVAFRGHSDSEVLLELYRRDGHGCFSRLNGIFALAVYDRRRAELVLARDAFGVKPLYLCETSDGVSFASEIKALLPALGAERALDPVAIDRYLSFLWCPGSGTPLARVRKLEPGTAIAVEAGRVTRRWRWYELPARRGVRAGMTEGEAVAAVRAGLRRAVERQLVADVPVGAFLSGGLDSSAIVAFARERSPDIRCFTIDAGAADAGDTSDLPYAERVARHLDVALDVVRVDPARMAADLEAMVWQLDEPLADPAPLNVLYIARLAREHGVKVLLSGAGGDDLFTGYRRHLAWRMEGLWSWLPRPARQALDSISSRLDQRRGVARRLSRMFAGAAADGDARLCAYFAWARRADLWPLYSDAMRAAIGRASPAQPMLDFLATVPAGVSRIERMLALEQRFFLSDHNLNYTDKMSMAVGVEVRVPFLDTELVELAARVPERFKQHGRVGKWVLKKALEPDLPHAVIYRPKTGFGAPLRRWMRHELRPLLDDLLGEASLRRRGLFDPGAVARLIADNDAGRKDAAFTLLSLLCIEIWCRRFVDTAASGAPIG